MTQRHRLIWSHHHLLLDGWSIPLLLKEVFTLYEGLCRNEPVQLAPVRPYGDYISWLQSQPLEEAERYWREKLRGLSSPTTLALGRRREARAEGESEYRKQRLHLSAAETAELSAAARRHQLTLNTIVQGAWSILLSRYSGERGGGVWDDGGGAAGRVARSGADGGAVYQHPADAGADQ